MAVDEGFHGLAQQHYLKALELAGSSEDHLTYCTTLRGMSVQAVDQGHGPYAMRLADAAAAASPRQDPACAPSSPDNRPTPARTSGTGGVH